jgi:uncharacterized ferredoxin-like protein
MITKDLFETPVVSSWIEDLTWDEESGCTILTTLTGRSYYFRMSYEKYEDWLNFSSKGSFYHYYVKESYMKKLNETKRLANLPIARRSDVEYTEKKIKGIIDRVTALLSGKQEAPFNRIANIYKRIDTRIKKLSERKDLLNDAVKRKAESLFDAEDAILTRVVETATLSIMLTKPGLPTTKTITSVDYENAVLELTGLLTEIDNQLNAVGQQMNIVEKFQSILDKHTSSVERITPGAPQKLRIDYKEQKPKIAESIENIDNFEVLLTNILDTFNDKVQLWSNKFDNKLIELKYEIIDL